MNTTQSKLILTMSDVLVLLSEKEENEEKLLLINTAHYYLAQLSKTMSMVGMDQEQRQI